MNVIKMTDLDLRGKRVLIRADLNVPVADGKVTSDARITASMATIEYALNAGAKVMVTSHLGRPEEGIYSEENSLKPVVDVVTAKLKKPVRLIKDCNVGFLGHVQSSSCSSKSSSSLIIAEPCIKAARCAPTPPASPCKS